MSDQQLDDYLSHMLGTFLVWVIEGQSQRVPGWDALTDTQQLLYGLRKGQEFMALYNQCRLEVEQEIA